jgi:hypothetical protein
MPSAFDTPMAFTESII